MLEFRRDRELDNIKERFDMVKQQTGCIGSSHLHCLYLSTIISRSLIHPYRAYFARFYPKIIRAIIPIFNFQRAILLKHSLTRGAFLQDALGFEGLISLLRVWLPPFGLFFVGTMYFVLELILIARVHFVKYKFYFTLYSW